MSGDAMHERVGLVTAREAQALDEDLSPLADALHHAGVDVAIVPWDEACDWEQFDLLLLRSTCNYMSRLAEFLSWAEHVARVSRLVNSLVTIRWNIDKHYLGMLADAGVPVVPTTFLEPGADVTAALEQFLAAQSHEEFVVKPAIGAGSRDAARHGRHAPAAALNHVERLLSEGRSVLVQPYLARVDEEGEAALIYFGGHFSHSIRKNALLRPGAGATTGLFATETIAARTARPDELAVARRALAATPGPMPPYARVDLLRDHTGAPRLLELELIEHSLFFAHAPGAAARFAAIIRNLIT